MSKKLLNIRHEAGHLKIVYFKLPEVRKCGKVTQGVSMKPFGSEADREFSDADMEPLDEWE